MQVTPILMPYDPAPPNANCLAQLENYAILSLSPSAAGEAKALIALHGETRPVRGL
jgi:hypothetical protein